MSRYYVWRRGSRRHPRFRWPKLTVVCDIETHLWLAAYVCMGPCQDSPQFPEVVVPASRAVPIDVLLGDKGYDAEHNHRMCREELGIRRTWIPCRRRQRRSKHRLKWPTTQYRREMRAAFDYAAYGQRWQAESAFSQHKRRFGPALRARTWGMQQGEIYLRVLTHNVALLAAA